MPYVISWFYYPYLWGLRKADYDVVSTVETRHVSRSVDGVDVCHRSRVLHAQNSIPNDARAINKKKLPTRSRVFHAEKNPPVIRFRERRIFPRSPFTLSHNDNSFIERPRAVRCPARCRRGAAEGQMRFRSKEVIVIKSHTCVSPNSISACVCVCKVNVFVYALMLRQNIVVLIGTRVILRARTTCTTHLHHA